MKKLLVLLMVACLVFACSMIVAAATPTGNHEGNIDKDINSNVSDSVTLTAMVKPYASIHFIFAAAAGPQTLSLSGKANETATGTFNYRVETNCDTWADGFGTAFKGINHGDILATSYSCTGGDPNNASPYKVSDGSTVQVGGAHDQLFGSSVQTITYTASTGATISSQHADKYQANFFIVVYENPNYVDGR